MGKTRQKHRSPKLPNTLAPPTSSVQAETSYSNTNTFTCDALSFER